MIEKPRHLVAGARRVRDQHHAAAVLAKARQRLACGGKRYDAVMNDAPHVGEHRVVLRGKRGEVIGQDRDCHWLYSPSCPALCRASTSFLTPCAKTWMAGTSPAMTSR